MWGLYTCGGYILVEVIYVWGVIYMWAGGGKVINEFQDFAYWFTTLVKDSRHTGLLP